jgi:hypothetical protein
MRKLSLTLLLGLLAISVGCTSPAATEPAGDGVVRLVFFWSET